MPDTRLSLPTERDLRRLARLHAPGDGVLSLYLDFDPAGGARRNVRAAVNTAFDSARERLGDDAALLAAFERERRAVTAWVREFKLQGRSLILFFCQPLGLLDVFQLHVPVRPAARFEARPFVSPLAAVLDEHERYGVVLIDKEQARILTVYLDQVEAQTLTHGSYPGRTAMGGWAQARYERHRDAHLHRHVLRVTGAIEREYRRRDFDRLVVGGPDEARAALMNALPRSLRSRVVGNFTIELFASDDDVRRLVRDLAEEAERVAELETVTDLIDGAKAGAPAVLGWARTLEALTEGRVHQLVAVDRLRKAGYACPNRDFAATDRARSCPFCGAALGRVADLREWAVEAAFDTKASVETVRGEAAERLHAEEGIGAVLRY